MIPEYLSHYDDGQYTDEEIPEYLSKYYAGQYNDEELKKLYRYTDAELKRLFRQGYLSKYKDGYKSFLRATENPPPVFLNLPSEGRQNFTRWRWSYPNSTINLKSKTFFIKYEKPLSTIDKLLLNNFQKKYLYHAIEDIHSILKFQSIQRDNLLAILYSSVISLQNNLSIDFFDIWIDEISINKVSKSNKFLATHHKSLEPFSYITIKLVYSWKPLPKKMESLW